MFSDQLKFLVEAFQGVTLAVLTNQLLLGFVTLTCNVLDTSVCNLLRSTPPPPTASPCLIFRVEWPLASYLCISPLKDAGIVSLSVLAFPGSQLYLFRQLKF